MEDEKKYLKFRDFVDSDPIGNRFQLLKTELEQIAESLQPKYSGRLVVERFVPHDADVAYSDWNEQRNKVRSAVSMFYPFLAISEVTEEKKMLGLVKNEKKRIILAFGEIFTGEEDYVRQLDAIVADARAEAVLRDSAKRIADDHGLTGISIERFH